MKTLIFAASLLAITAATGQNLVPNGSFEQYTRCPNNYSQADFATGWIKSLTSNHGTNNDHTDYFNSCGSTSFNTPINVWGNETPSHGVAYQGMAPKYTPYGVDYRENIYVQLASPLVVGTPYYVSFQISLADDFQKATDKMGIKFSTVPGFDINNFAHVYCLTPVTNQNGWTTIQAIFTADSAYNYLGLGNFFQDHMTNEVVVCTTCSHDASLYYLDNLKVFKVCEWVDSVRTDSVIDNGEKRINNKTATKQFIQENSFSVFPSPASSELQVVYNYPQNKGEFKLELFDQKGAKVKTINLDAKNMNSSKIEITDLSPGIYLSLLSCNGETLSTQKIIKE